MKAAVEEIEVTMDELDGLLEQAKAALPPREYETLRKVVNAYVYITGKIADERTTIQWLRQLLGSKSEKTKKVLERAGLGAGGNGQESTQGHETTGGNDKPKARGHGRHGAEAYSGAERIEVTHASLKRGERCPGCGKGKLYRRKKPRVIVRIRGAAPLQADLYELETLRCNLCGEVFTAKPPAGVGEAKYDPSAGAMIGLLKYGTGLPFYRLDGLQASVGIPLPASTQWEIVEDAAGELMPVYRALVQEGAQGEILHNDDTGMTVLELMKKRPDPEEDGVSAERTGVFTSGIVSTREGRRIALFFTGRRHAGENLAEVLKKRAVELAPPIQMCDALSRNFPKGLDAIVANCMAHGRRQFVNVAESFPEECRHVLEVLKEVYQNDATARERQLSPDERLRFHQVKSGPVMEALQEWLSAQLDEKKVEPNSRLGKAIAYMQRHWPELTLFLREPGAPLDNNICERALKRVILHRKNALFFRTKNGARVGDLFMSLIHTCELSDADPFEYLTEILRNTHLLEKNPQAWLPWSYRDTLAQIRSP